jgi:hypothetical protein
MKGTAMSDKGVKTRWKKGQSGNPRGRPLKGVTLPYAARQMMDQPMRYETNGEVIIVSRLERTLLEIIKRSDEGDLACMRFLLEQMSRWDRAAVIAARPPREAKLPMTAEQRMQRKLAAEADGAIERAKAEGRAYWEKLCRESGIDPDSIKPAKE